MFTREDIAEHNRIEDAKRRDTRRQELPDDLLDELFSAAENWDRHAQYRRANSEGRLAAQRRVFNAAIRLAQEAFDFSQETDQPRTLDAVDPHADSTGKRFTRAESSLFSDACGGGPPEGVR